MKTFFWCDLQQKVVLCFSANVGRHFLKSNNVGRHFCPDFRDFDQIFRDFAQIFRDIAQIFRDFARIFREFARILNKAKLFGERWHPRNLHH